MFEELVMPILDQPAIHHIGIIAINQHQIERTKTLLGLKETFSGYVHAYQAESFFLVGQEPSIEFILSQQPTLKNFNRGFGGIHHIAFQVSSIADITKKLSAQNITLFEPEPIPGAGPFVINFLPPKVLGYTIEFVELVNK